MATTFFLQSYIGEPAFALPSRALSAVAEYASCSEIIDIINNVNLLAQQEFRNFMTKLARQDAAELYGALKFLTSLCQILPIEPFKKCCHYFDKALGGRVYRSLVKSMEYTLQEQDEKAIHQKKKLRSFIVKNSDNKPIDIRLKIAATWTFQPSNSSHSVVALPCTGYPDVAELLAPHVVSQKLKDMCLAVWSETIDNTQKLGSHIALPQHHRVSLLSLPGMVNVHHAAHQKPAKKPVEVWPEDERYRAVNAILAVGADPNAKLSDLHGYSRLQEYSPIQGCRNIRILELLLDHRANPDAKDVKGNTILHEAAAFNHSQLVALLIRFRASPNSMNNIGCTPLYLAMRNCASESAHLLIDAKSNPTLPNEAGRTALDAAQDILDKLGPSIAKAKEWENEQLQAKLELQRKEILSLQEKMQQALPSPEKKLASMLTTSFPRRDSISSVSNSLSSRPPTPPPSPVPGPLVGLSIPARIKACAIRFVCCS